MTEIDKATECLIVFAYGMLVYIMQYFMRHDRTIVLGFMLFCVGAVFLAVILNRKIKSK